MGEAQQVKPRIVRHEFVVNAEKDPEVAAWIESPLNEGKVGATIVHLLRLHLWAAKHLEGSTARELLHETQQIAHTLDTVNARLGEVLEAGGYEPRLQDSTGAGEQHKTALDNL